LITSIVLQKDRVHQGLLRREAASLPTHAIQGASRLPAQELDVRIAQDFELLAHSFAAQELPVARFLRGRPKQHPAKNLFHKLLQCADQMLAFLDDLPLPFTNNHSERDLRMVKAQQKIVGTFRSPAGLSVFCRLRSYLSTMHKQGHCLLTALAAVFAGRPLSVARGTEELRWMVCCLTGEVHT